MNDGMLGVAARIQTRGPYAVVKDFEEKLCEYTGAKFAVAVNSCTSAILLAVAWSLRPSSYPIITAKIEDGRLSDYHFGVEIPKRTYCSVPMSIIHAGGRPKFRDEDWVGAYQLRPLPVWDSARRFTSAMYVARQMQCVSFHASKILGLEQGGAILHDDPQADAWFRKSRFDARSEGVQPHVDDFTFVGWHCYMNPSTAAQGILKLYSLPKHNADLPNDMYPDLSTFEIFR